VFAGHNVGVKEVNDRIWLVTFMHTISASPTTKRDRLEPIENPFGPEMSRVVTP